MEVEGRLVVPQINTAPSSPVEGEIYWDSDDDKLYVWNGSRWIPASVPTQSAAPTNPQEGDVYWDTDDHALYGYDDNSDQWIHQGSGKAVPVGKAYRSAAQSVANGGVVTLDTDTNADPAGIFDTSTGRLTPTKAGWYRISAGSRVSNAVTASQYWLTTILKNGTRTAYGSTGAAPAASGAFSQAVDIVYCNGTTDYIQLGIEHNLGGSQPLVTGAESTYLSWEWISNDYAGGIVTPKAKVQRTSDQALSHAVWSTVTWQSESYDHGNMWSVGSPTRLTAPVAGVYHFDVELRESLGAGDGSRDMAVRKNGTDISYVVAGAQSASLNYANYVQLSGEVQMAAGDYLEVAAYENSSGTVNIQSGSFFSMHMIPEPAGVIVPEGWHEIGGAGEIAFTAGWGHFDASETTWAKAKYMKDPFGFVHFKGSVIRSSGVSIIPFTLPAGYRPLKQLRFPMISAGVASFWDISPTGTVSCNGTPGSSNFLDGITFKAEQ